ncbi:hypothetical protein ABH931_007503 [Streptacidiphilus sp. MAP12-33]|uniref:hypothetical protein n=1 Tax=Streptacidiphilus sp. MAP12-33 TaxID=3156266 RepID=UPI0035136539
MEPDRPEDLSAPVSPAPSEPAAPAAPGAPMTMLDAVGRLSPEQAGLLGVLIGLRRLDDGPPPEAKPETAPEPQA